MFRLIAAVSATVWAAIQWWMVLVWVQMERQYGAAFLHAHHIEPVVRRIGIGSHGVGTGGGDVDLCDLRSGGVKCGEQSSPENQKC
jgi:hypothetical protein